jgi:DNA polymerase III gamma/tau subunit
MTPLASLAKEGVEVEPEALAMIARAAEGSVRDSLSLLDQAIAHAGETERTRGRDFAPSFRCACCRGPGRCC